MTAAIQYTKTPPDAISSRMVETIESNMISYASHENGVRTFPQFFHLVNRFKHTVENQLPHMCAQLEIVIPKKL